MNKPPPGKKPQPHTNKDREVRQAAALRANLLKRKDQTRQREAAKPKPDR
jgi:hypothetical protein